MPLYEYQGERKQLIEYAEKKGPEGLRKYRAQKNRTSIDGLRSRVWLHHPAAASQETNKNGHETIDFRPVLDPWQPLQTAAVSWNRSAITRRTY